MEGKAADSPVCLRIPSFRTGKQKLRDAQPPKPAPKPEAEKAPAKP